MKNEQKIKDIANSVLSDVNHINNDNVTVKNNSFLHVVNNILFISNVLFLIVNVYYACHYYPRTKNLDFDYTGIIIGVLSILITLLVGWQIYSNIYIKNNIEKYVRNEIYKMEKRNKIYEQKLNKEIERSKCMAIGVSLAQLGISQYYTNDYENAIRSLFNALIFLQKIKIKDDLSEEARQHVERKLEEVSCKVNGSKCIEFEKEEINLFKGAAIQTGNEKIILLVMKMI